MWWGCGIDALHEEISPVLHLYCNGKTHQAESLSLASTLHKMVSLGKKRQRDEDDDGPGPSGNQAPTVGQQTSHIKNKQVRGAKYAKLKHEKNKLKKKERALREKEVARAEELGIEPPPKPVPKVGPWPGMHVGGGGSGGGQRKAPLQPRYERAAALRCQLHPPAGMLQTIENTREKDETMVQPDDAEVAAGARAMRVLDGKQLQDALRTLWCCCHHCVCVLASLWASSLICFCPAALDHRRGPG